MNRRVLLAFLMLLPAMACAQTDTSKPQAELPKEKLVIVTQQEVGLMFRPTVPADGGMLFDWGTPRDIAMWMRNTVAPLDMLFINADGTIRRIAENTTPQSLATIPAGGAGRGALEAAAGTAARLHIRVGDKVEQRIFNNAS